MIFKNVCTLPVYLKILNSQSLPGNLNETLVTNTKFSIAYCSQTDLTPLLFTHPATSLPKPSHYSSVCLLLSGGTEKRLGR